jgi:predicted ATPase with chaperone activity
MAKEQVQKSLERDAYLSRHDDKEDARERLQKSVERLSKLMSLSADDRAELSVYADQLLEQRTMNETQEKESQVRRRVMQARASQQNLQDQVSFAQSENNQASD